MGFFDLSLSFSIKLAAMIVSVFILVGCDHKAPLEANEMNPQTAVIDFEVSTDTPGSFGSMTISRDRLPSSVVAPRPTPLGTPGGSLLIIKRVNTPIIEHNTRTKQVVEFELADGAKAIEFHDRPGCDRLLAPGSLASGSGTRAGSVTLPFALNRTIYGKIFSAKGNLVKCEVLYAMSVFDFEPLQLRSITYAEPTSVAAIATWGSDFLPYEPSVELFRAPDCSPESKLISASLKTFTSGTGVRLDFKTVGSYAIYARTSSRHIRSELCSKLGEVTIKPIAPPRVNEHIQFSGQEANLLITGVASYHSQLEIFFESCDPANLVKSFSLPGKAIPENQRQTFATTILRPNRYRNMLRGRYISDNGKVSECSYLGMFPDITGRTAWELKANIITGSSGQVEIAIERMNGSAITIYRKLFDQAGFGEPIATLGPYHQDLYVDQQVSRGLKYEYLLVNDTQTKLLAFGYEIPAKTSEGLMLILVDRSLSEKIADALGKYVQALKMDGWQVMIKDVARAEDSATYLENDAIDAANNKNNAEQIALIKSLIRQTHTRSAGRLKAVLLLGHVPVPQAGVATYDGHPEHYGAWPTDSYYTDFTGQWKDEARVDSYFRNPFYYQSPDGTAKWPAYQTTYNRNVPGDGKFDEMKIPGKAEVQIGRIDFWNLAFLGEGAGTLTMEAEQIKRYILKNIAYRRGQMSFDKKLVFFEARGFPLDMARSKTEPLSLFQAPEVFSKKQAGGSEAATYLSEKSSLWLEGRGWGWYTSAAGSLNSNDIYQQGRKLPVVFSSLFGSYFGDWYYPNNLLRSAIGSADADPVAAGQWGLVAFYSQSHQYHRMSLGDSIGETIRVSQNKNTYLPALYMQSAAPFTVLGDPTLTMYSVKPVSAMTAIANTNDDQVRVSWAKSSDPDVQQYTVFKAKSVDGPFVNVGTTSSFTMIDDRAPVSRGYNIYMIKAAKIFYTPSGSFWKYSSGVVRATTTFVKPSPTPVQTPAPN